MAKSYQMILRIKQITLNGVRVYRNVCDNQNYYDFFRTTVDITDVVSRHVETVVLLTRNT